MLNAILSPVAARSVVVVCAVLLVLAAPLFFVGGPDWVSSTLLKNLWNFGHVVFFALLLIVVQWFVPLTRWRQWLGVTLLALLLGAVVEVVQHFVGRHASWGDLFNNLVGVWLGLFWGQHLGAAPYPNRVRWARALSLLLVGPALWLVLEAAWAELSLRRAFPLVNSFESRAEWQQLVFNPARIGLQPSTAVVSHGEQSLQVDLMEGRYSGLRLRVCYGVWQKFNAVAMDLFNPEADPLPVVLRLSDAIHDRGDNHYDDRFNRALLLQPGWNRLRFAIDDIANSPKQRSMQLDALCNLGIFAADLPRSRRFYLDNIRLE